MEGQDLWVKERRVARRPNQLGEDGSLGLCNYSNTTRPGSRRSRGVGTGGGGRPDSPPSRFSGESGVGTGGGGRPDSPPFRTLSFTRGL